MPLAGCAGICPAGATALLDSPRGDQPRVGPGVQGHDGQFLSLLALSKVPIDYGLKVGGEVFTVADLVEFEKRTCLPKTELSFKLLALVHYLDSDAAWQNQDGEDWDIPRLIKEELAQPVIGGTCGGTHRMLGLSYAVRKREKRGEPIDGQWVKARNTSRTITTTIQTSKSRREFQ